MIVGDEVNHCQPNRGMPFIVISIVAQSKRQPSHSQSHENNKKCPVMHTFPCPGFMKGGLARSLETRPVMLAMVFGRPTKKSEKNENHEKR